MKLVTYDQGGAPRAGLWSGGVIADLEQAGRALRTGALSASIRELLEAGIDSAGKTATAVEKLIRNIERGKTRAPKWLIPDEDAHLNAPVPDPTKIICLGQNYLEHFREQTTRPDRPVEPPKTPVLFAKFPSSLTGPNDPVVLPPETVTAQVDFEVELALVIGRTTRGVNEKNAMASVAGFMALSDISARDCQFADKQWVRAKSFDTFAPCGPWLATRDEVPHPQRLRLWTVLNGETMQDGNTRDMIHKLPRIVSFISEAITLYPGDIISTGTPAGVGIFRNPPVVLKSGDVLETGVEAVGTLVNPIQGSKSKRGARA